MPKMSSMEWLPEGDLLLSLSFVVGGMVAQFSLMLTRCKLAALAEQNVILNVNYVCI